MYIVLKTINYHNYIILSSQLKHLMGRDINADINGEYHIRSLYFDDYNSAYKKFLEIIEKHIDKEEEDYYEEKQKI